MHKLIFVLFLFSFQTVRSQVIELQKKITAQFTKSEEFITLKYFKKVDDILLKKLDSFDLFLSQEKYELDSTFFYEIWFRKINDKQAVTICYQSQYHDYLMISNSLKATKKKSPFAFFFYKNKLVICSVFSRTLDLSKESKVLLKNLIYEHIKESEKALIKNPPNAVIVESKPVKRYYLE